MSKYIVLHNKKASTFVDTGSGAVVHSHTKPTKVEKITKRMQEAITGGHIREIEDADQAEKMIKDAEAKEKALAAKNAALAKGETVTEEDSDLSEDEDDDEEVPATKEELEAMDDKALLKYYKDNFDVTKADADAFKAMSKEEKITFLLA